MPIWLRNFTFRSIQDHFDKIKEAQDKANKIENTGSKSIARPPVTPTHTTKVSRS